MLKTIPTAFALTLSCLLAGPAGAARCPPIALDAGDGGECKIANYGDSDIPSVVITIRDSSGNVVERCFVFFLRPNEIRFCGFRNGSGGTNNYSCETTAGDNDVPLNKKTTRTSLNVYIPGTSTTGAVADCF